MKRGLLVGIAFQALMLCVLPVFAASPDPAADALLAAIFAPAEEAPAPEAGNPAEPVTLDLTPAPENRAVQCFANCWNGTSVDCFGIACQGVNSNCAAGERGYCMGTITGIRNCPACPPPCTVRATCSPSGSVSCTSYKNNCFKVERCYVSCDNKLKWCPQHGTCPI